jgi:hypothetical protein
MRIAIIVHGDEDPTKAGASHADYAIGLLANIWRAEGHEVRFLIGYRERWEADIAILHVVTSTVPNAYARLAETYPVTINGAMLDNRKSRVSRSLVTEGSSYNGPVIVKTDLNNAGITEQMLGARSVQRLSFRVVAGLTRRLRLLSGRGETPYSIYESLESVPVRLRSNPKLVIERFCPEKEGDWYFVRRSFFLGDRFIGYRMGDKQPIIDAGLPGAFEWIETPPQVLAARRDLRLDYGTIDYAVHEGEVVVFDVNKTPGRAAPPTEATQRDYATILSTVAPGISGFVGEELRRAPRSTLT